MTDYEEWCFAVLTRALVCFVVGCALVLGIVHVLKHYGVSL